MASSKHPEEHLEALSLSLLAHGLLFSLRTHPNPPVALPSGSRSSDILACCPHTPLIDPRSELGKEGEAGTREPTWDSRLLMPSLSFLPQLPRARQSPQAFHRGVRRWQVFGPTSVPGVAGSRGSAACAEAGYCS